MPKAVSLPGKLLTKTIPVWIELYMDLKQYISEKRTVINQALEKHLGRYTLSHRLLEPMAYSVAAGGKRLRPVLCLASCEAVGGTAADAMEAACALEMIHTYSLIHDDLPALDDDRMRRGVPTCHVRFNEAMAVLAGDGLLNTAFELLADWVAQTDHGVGIHARIKVIQTIARAAGCRGMIEGQARDLDFEGRTIELEDLEAMHRLKTGAMIRASVVSGAIIGGADRQQLQCLDTYSLNIGLAFQVVDDILNVVGDPAVLGKAVGTDSRRCKNTYPALLGLEAARQKASQLVDRAVDALGIFGNEADPLRAIACYVLERNR